MCDDCELEDDDALLDAMIMDNLRRIRPSNDPKQIAAENALAKVMRLTFRVVN